MSSELIIAGIILPSAVAATAGFGAWRCWRLLRYGGDPRLQKLMLFYSLLAASLVSLGIWTGQQSEPVGDALIVAHHAFLLAGLVVGVQAFSHKHTKSAAVATGALAFFGPFIPVILALEAVMTLYIAVQAILNHRERRTPGARQVAAGFLLFFIGHLIFFLFHDPGGTGIPLGGLFALAGLVLLVRLLPRPST